MDTSSYLIDNSNYLKDEISSAEMVRRLLLGGRYTFHDRGVIKGKGKGPMRTYFLRGL
jgi:hypothetical protein